MVKLTTSSKVRTVSIAAMLVLIAAGSIASLSIVSSSEYRADSLIGRKPTESKLGLRVRTTAVNVETSLLRLLLTPYADGVFGKSLPNGALLDNGVLLNLDVADGPSSVQLTASDVTGGIPVGVTLQGTSNSYPFDRYTAQLFASASLPSVLGGREVANFALVDEQVSLPGFKINAEAVSFLTGRSSEEDIREDRSQGFGVERWVIERSSATRISAILIGSLMLIGGLVSVLITAAIALGIRPPSINAMAWLAAFLFSMMQLRDQLPGQPPIGIAFDKIIFFPVIISLVLCISINLVAWVLRDDWDMENPLKATKGKLESVSIQEHL